MHECIVWIVWCFIGVCYTRLPRDKCSTLLFKSIDEGNEKIYKTDARLDSLDSLLFYW